MVYYSRDDVIAFIRSYRHSTDVAFHMEEHLYEIPEAKVVPKKELTPLQKELVRVYRRTYYEANKEHLRELQREYYRRRKEKGKVKVKNAGF